MLTLRKTKGSPLTNDELDGNFENFTGSHSITGSLTASVSIYSPSISGSFTGSLEGTASTSSYAVTSSYAITASYFNTSSLLNNSFTSSYNTGSFTGSFTGNGLGLTNINTASLNGFYNYTASLNDRITIADNKTGSYASVSSSNQFNGTNIFKEITVGYLSGSNGQLDFLNASGETKFVFANNQMNILGNIYQTQGSSSFTAASFTEIKGANTGTGSICGTGTLESGALTIFTDKVTNDSIIICTKKNIDTLAHGDHVLTIDNITPNVSFTVNSNGSSANSDSDSFSWLIINPA